MDTEPWPPRRGTQEEYIVKNEVWQQAGMTLGMTDPDTLAIRGGGILCVGCIEKRLGRLLTKDDFSPLTLDVVMDCQSTARLLSRVGIALMNIAHQPLPDHIVDEWLASTLRNVLKNDRGLGRVDDVEVDGEAIILKYKTEHVIYRAGPKLLALREAMRWDRTKGLGDGEIDLLPWDDAETA